MSQSHTPTEFKYRLAEVIRRERIKYGYESVEKLSEATRIPVWELMKLEMGELKNPAFIFRLARFYEKKVAITFF